METTKKLTGTFKESCKVVDLVKEYTGSTPYTGKERYAIVTSLSESELAYYFGDDLAPYKPYVVLTPKMYAVITESNKNDEREHKRTYRHHDAFAIDDERAPEALDSDPAVMAESDFTYSHIINEMKKLPGRQGQRMYQHYVLGYSIDEIALAEGVTAASVYESLDRGKKAIRKVFIESGVTEE